MIPPDISPRWRRAGIELGLMLVMGLFMGTLGPYGTGFMSVGQRYLYWVACIMGGGAIGIAIDEGLAWRAGSFGRRLAATSLLMTPAVTLFVTGTGHVVAGQPLYRSDFPGLLWQVFVICVPVMAFRALVWRSQRVAVETRTVIETRTVTASPLPEAEAAFRQRLSAKRRSARLIAVEAYDHYLRVHTDAGPELVTLRFADALVELAGAHGFRIHRSWWVAAGAIEAVRWRRGAGEARLTGGLTAPVSRAHGPALKAAGWF